MARYYPALIDLKDKACLVVGGGVVAARKVASLLECGAQVTVVSPRLDAALEDAAAAGRITAIRREMAADDISGSFLAIAAGDDRQVNALVAEAARRAGVLVNVVDDPRRCDFIVPAVVRRGDLTIAISTSGRSPALAGHLRRQVASLFAAEYADLLDLLAEVREELRGAGATVHPEAWRDMLGEEPLALLREGRREDAKRRLSEALLAASRCRQKG